MGSLLDILYALICQVLSVYVSHNLSYLEGNLGHGRRTNLKPKVLPHRN